MKASGLPEVLQPNGVLSIIQRDIESGGEYFALNILKNLLEEDQTVFVFLYEPFTVFKRNCGHVGLDVNEYIGKNLILFDVFGSMYHIPAPTAGIHQLSGYLDDSVFIIKLKEWANSILKSRDWKRLWIFTYTSAGVCKLFTRPSLVYKLIWGLRKILIQEIEDAGTILTLSTVECPEIEDIAYFASDVVVETLIMDGKRVGIITKGPNEGRVFELFRGDER
ncbi:hypothetical protein [Thermococcus sp. 21S7]|uniref:hypothetical protein n=1 Tax=Thermococcus sp. 21S7 TaxID=1638221 RepID=UPI00143C31D6|nr:hypothetical protein [Thermococcus sp. 21S7]NJE62050.1 hypothetical protein [Thermococcus sp. 21S7]